MDQLVKKTACFLPGLGTPVSLYYTITSKELRGTALKGLAMLPAAGIVLSMGTIIPSSIAMLAGAYIYWGIIALAGGWGFVAMLAAWRAIETHVVSPIEPIPHMAPELIPRTSVSEVIPDMDANNLLSQIERLPTEDKQELVATIVKKMIVEKKE